MNINRKCGLMLTGSFAAAITAGMLLLKLPVAVKSGELSWIDALFTSTSAVCVTGLTTVPTVDFSLTGQLFILLLIQIGGLGIMVMTASLVIALAGSMRLGGRLLMYETLSSLHLNEVERILRMIIIYTFATEALGAVMLLPGFLTAGHEPLTAAYHAVFHSVSAFCNAGFSTFDDSLVGANAWVKSIIGVLIILGGLGFYVIFDLWLLHCDKGGQSRRLTVHTRLVLISTVILLAGGGIGIWLLENIEGEGIGALDAAFQSVTARTAGFNSVKLGALRPSSILILIVLMFIGASPGSTGGGVKTTTAAIALTALYKTLKGEQRIVCFGRDIPPYNVFRAFLIIITYFLLIVLGVLAISTQRRFSLQGLVFETVSALGTVGLSVGVTAAAYAQTKIALVILMYLGRIGPFAMFLFLMAGSGKGRLRYPQEKIILG